jgi:hypothetical protein
MLIPCLPKRIIQGCNPSLNRRSGEHIMRKYFSAKWNARSGVNDRHSLGSLYIIFYSVIRNQLLGGDLGPYESSHRCFKVLQRDRLILLPMRIDASTGYCRQLRFAARSKARGNGHGFGKLQDADEPASGNSLSTCERTNKANVNNGSGGFLRGRTSAVFGSQ